MYRNKFLDSWDEKKFELLLYLNSHNNNCTKEACYTYLGITPKTLFKICQSLDDVSKETDFFTLDITQNRLLLKINDQKNLSNIFFYFLSKSTNYAVISQLFYKKEINMLDLQDELGISHSTLYRKLDELNELLSVFKLKISNKSLKGPELQIRHFFVDYSINFIPHDYLLENLTNTKINDSVDFFEESFNLKLSPEANLLLKIYLSIVKKRYEKDKIDTSSLMNEFPFTATNYTFSTQLSFMNVYQKSFIYKDLSEYLDTFFNKFNLKNSPEETIMFLLFLMGNNIVPINSKIFNAIMTIQDSSNSPITGIVGRILDLLISNQLLNSDDLFLQKEISDYINIICWNQSIYYGGIYMYEDSSFENFIDLRKFKPIREFINNFFTSEYPEMANYESQNKSFITNLLLIFLFASNHSSKSYKIGVDIQGEMMHSKLIQMRLINRINSLGYVVATKVQPLSQYDLIVSNIDSPAFRKQSKDYYLLNHQFTPEDFNIIEEVIRKKVE
ncbi:helix-turn-helix domain-containing protein [Companilactobacillus sp. DQM5]|uniref:helix-turn-helix domain-containing protein n=1 Tax=Companilactobacillus sp. DQM5 TaxID=3463359 RepID=UPI0040586A50